MSKAFSREEEDLIDEIKNCERARSQYQGWSDNAKNKVKELEDSIVSYKQVQDREQRTANEYEEKLFKAREQLRVLLQVPTPIIKFPATIVKDTLDALESRSNVEKSNAQGI